MRRAWSYSSLSAYETCPKQYYETKILKKWKQPDSEQIKWGNEVHKALEQKGIDGTELPERMQHYNPIVRKFFDPKLGTAYVEHKVAITVDHKPCEFDSDGAWARGIIDRLVIKGHTALNIDWKTGKKKDSSRQLAMSTALVFANFPEIEKVTTAFVWLNEPEGRRITKGVYWRSEYRMIWALFDKPLKELEWSEQNNAWPPKQSGLCRRWCPVLDCPFNGLNPEGKR